MNHDNRPRISAIALLASSLALSQSHDGVAAPGDGDVFDATVVGTMSVADHEGIAVYSVGELWAQARSNAGVNSERTELSPSYELAVEGDEEYSVTVEAALLGSDDLDASDSMDDVVSRHLRIARTTYDMVVDDGTGAADHQEDFTYDVARIDAEVVVLGGTITAIEVEAFANIAHETYRATAREQNMPPAAYPTQDTVSLLTVPTDSTNVYGTVYVQTDSGVALSRPLISQPVDLLDPQPQDASVSWQIDLIGVGPNIAIDGSISGVIPAAVVTAGHLVTASHTISVEGRGGVTEGFEAILAPLLPNPADPGETLFFQILPGLIAGEYDVRALTEFDSPEAALSRRVTVAVDAPPPDVDFVEPFGVLEASVFLSGFYGPTTATQIRVTALGPPGDFAYSTHDGGYAAIPVEPGRWRASQYSVSISGDQLPTAELFGNDYWRPSMQIAAGQVGSVDPFEVTTVATAITFDVLDVGVVPALLSDIEIYGSGMIDGIYKQFYAYGPAGAEATPEVLIAAEPGTYMVIARATLDDGSRITWTPFSFEVEPGQLPNPEGVVVSSRASVNFEYAAITTPGLTTVTTSPIGPELDSGFQLFEPGSGGAVLYYDIYSEMEFTGSAEVCVTVPEEAIPNGAGAGVLAAFELRHWADCGDGYDVWCPIGSGAHQVGDDYRVCGLTDSFSPFVVVLPFDGDEDGIDVELDNCPEVANPTQRDLDGDGQGDECDDDDDDDGWDDADDNCPQDANPEQKDCDADGIGGICDDDDDDDGVLDEDDNCPKNANPAQNDFDGDGIGDACEGGVW